MTAAELVVRIKADIGDLTTKLAAAGAEIKALGDDAEKSNGKASRAFKDTEKGLMSLDKAAHDVRYKMNGGPLGLFGAIGEVTGRVLQLGSAVDKGAGDLGMWLQSIDQGSSALTGLGATITALGPMLSFVSVGIVAFGVSLLGLPILVGAAVFVLQLLADAVGTLGAIIYASLGPISVLVAILGGLGLAIFLAAQRAVKGGGQFKDFAGHVEKLVGKFHDLVYTIAGRLLPLFDRLAHAADIALTYFGKLAQMPLDQAMHSVATKGVKMLTGFLDQVGHVVANPIRMAIKIAFTTGTAQSQIGNILHGIGGFLFGKQISVPVGAHRGAAHGAGMVPKFQPGALQPIIDWFNRHNFTKTGKRWGNEIVAGIEGSGILGRLGNWFLQALEDAGKRGGKAFVKMLLTELVTFIPNILNWMGSTFQTEMGKLAGYEMKELGKAWDWVKSKASSVWNAIVSNASSEFHHIASNLTSMWSSAVSHAEGDWQAFTTWIGRVVGNAWNTVKTKAEGIWHQIISFIERPLSIHINWPSPPGWLSSIIGGALPGAGLVTSAYSRLTNSASGGIFTRPTPRMIGEAGAEAVIPLTGGMGRHVLGALGGGGGGVVVNINNPTFMSGGRPAARELARILKPELDRIVTAR